MATDQQHKDWALVLKLGGPKVVAEQLRYTGTGGVQRVQNWKSRGIPASVKVDRPDLFQPNVQVLPGQGVGQVGDAAAAECVGSA